MVQAKRHGLLQTRFLERMPSDSCKGMPACRARSEDTDQLLRKLVALMHRRPQERCAWLADLRHIGETASAPSAFRAQDGYRCRSHAGQRKKVWQPDLKLPFLKHVVRTACP